MELLFFFLSFKFLRIACIFLLPKYAQCAETDFLIHGLFFVVFFRFFDMVDFVINIRSELVLELYEFKKIIMLGGSATLIPPFLYPPRGQGRRLGVMAVSNPPKESLGG